MHGTTLIKYFHLLINCSLEGPETAAVIVTDRRHRLDTGNLLTISHLNYKTKGPAFLDARICVVMMKGCVLNTQ
jgi:hypothetical protein